jgi:hypothetical protein
VVIVERGMQRLRDAGYFGTTEALRMTFADVCALMPEGVYWGEPLTPQIARKLIQAGFAASTLTKNPSVLNRD